MSEAQRKVIDDRVSAGDKTTQGVLPPLDPVAAYYARIYFELRASTPGDQPINFMSLVYLVGREDALFLLPYIQIMDETYFGDQNERRKQALNKGKPAKKPAKAAPKSRRGRRR